MPNKPVKKTNSRMTPAQVKKKYVSADKSTRSAYDKIINIGEKEGKKLPARPSTQNSRQLTSKEARKTAKQRMDKLSNMLGKPKNKSLNTKTTQVARDAGIVKGWSKNRNSNPKGANTRFRDGTR